MSDTLTHIAPRLNPALDSASFAHAFQRDGRVHIPSLMDAAGAARVYRCLELETHYELTINSGDGEHDVWIGDQAKVTQAQRDRLAAAAYEAARTGFQFMFETRQLTSHGEPHKDPAHYHAAIVEFLNSDGFLDLVRAVTGSPQIAFADAQATRYGPGHFLTAHDDNFPARNRVAAYVLSMTPRWRPDWGGILMFPSSDGNIKQGYCPRFNALNIFKVPQQHMVSLVSPFAGAPRYSVTGWLRAR